MNKSYRNGQKTISQKLASYAGGLSCADLPGNVKEIAGTRILDALSCAYEGRDLPHSRVALGLIGGEGDCTVYGSDNKAPLLDGAMVNSVLVHSTMQVDNLPVSGHPSTIIVPVVLAVGEQEQASGAEIITAIVIGYEIMQRIGRGVTPLRTMSIRISPLAGALGAAAAAGRLMKLGADKLTNAIGYAANMATGMPNQAWWAGTMEPTFHAGSASRTAILAAMLGRAGATAAPDVFEGRDGFLSCWAGTPERASIITDELGESFAITGVTVKPYPVGAGIQLMVQVALGLSGHKLAAADIREVIQKSGTGAFSYPGSSYAGPFISHFQAIISVPFCVAAAILGRPVASVDLYAKHYEDPEIKELAAKIKLVEEAGRKSPKTEVSTVDRRVLSTPDGPPASVALLPTQKNMERRFMASAPAVIGEERARKIVGLVKGLEKVADIRELTALL